MNDKKWIYPITEGELNSMATSKAQQKAQNKWIAKAYDRINLTVPKGQKDLIQAHAEAQGESTNGFINRAISETMERDGKPKTDWQRRETPYNENTRWIEMWDEKDLQAIDEIFAHRMNVILESAIMPKFNLLAENQKTMMETRIPEDDFEDLKEDVQMLRAIVRKHSQEIKELKRAWLGVTE